MSIINEALKKAGTIKQETVERKVPPTAESAQEPPPAEKKPAARKNKKNVNKKIIFFIILIIVTSAIFFIKNTRFIHEDKMVPVSNTPVAGRTQGRVAMPALTLNGIVYDEERPYAIVNNKVLLKGDMINGATLVEINQDSVKFRFNDADIELKSK